MHKFSRGLLSAAAIAAMLGLAGGAQASTYTFNDPGWASGSINTSTGVVILDALFTNPADVSDTISGLVMTFSTVPSSPSLSSQLNTTGNMVTFASVSNPNHPPGPPTIVAGTTAAGGPPTNWALSQSLAVLTLSTNNSCGGTPCDLIVGAGPYSGGNTSLITHSPFIDQEGKFVITGLTNLVLSGLVVQFGTVPTNRLENFICTDCSPPGPPPNPTPLPGAVWLFGTVIAGGVGVRRWRKRRAEAIAA